MTWLNFCDFPIYTYDFKYYGPADLYVVYPAVAIAVAGSPQKKSQKDRQRVAISYDNRIVDFSMSGKVI